MTRNVHAHTAGQVGAAVVRGIQSNGVIACAKHWVNNNQVNVHLNDMIYTWRFRFPFLAQRLFLEQSSMFKVRIFST